jgi:hypothetical protein
MFDAKLNPSHKLIVTFFVSLLLRQQYILIYFDLLWCCCILLANVHIGSNVFPSNTHLLEPADSSLQCP